jgi:hypothetical protein
VAAAATRSSGSLDQATSGAKSLSSRWIEERWTPESRRPVLGSLAQADQATAGQRLELERLRSCLERGSMVVAEIAAKDLELQAIEKGA